MLFWEPSGNMLLRLEESVSNDETGLVLKVLEVAPAGRLIGPVKVLAGEVKRLLSVLAGEVKRLLSVLAGEVTGLLMALDGEVT